MSRMRDLRDRTRAARTRAAAATAVALTAALVPVGAAGAAPRAGGAGGTCTPEVIDLGALTGDRFSEVQAMNDRGWAVGHSGTEFSRAVLWREGTFLDLGIGGRVTPTGVTVRSEATDVNEDGVVAAVRTRTGGDGVPSSAWLWQDDVRTRLPAGRTRSSAYVGAVNDHGVAVGHIREPRDFDLATLRPVLWRDARLVRLPLPRGAVAGQASENNDSGLVVGSVTRADGTDLAWWWRVGGRSGPLQRPRGGAAPGTAVDVDAGDRIVGALRGGRAVIWAGPRARARLLPVAEQRPSAVLALDDSGDLVGYTGGDRTSRPSPWVARPAGEVTLLPDLQGAGEADGGVAKAVIRGVTDFAPNGGVSVGGFATIGAFSPDDGAESAHATIWTCAYQH